MGAKDEEGMRQDAHEVLRERHSHMGIHEQASMLERRFGVQKSTHFGDVTTEGVYRVSLPSISRYHNLKSVSALENVWM